MDDHQLEARIQAKAHKAAGTYKRKRAPRPGVQIHLTDAEKANLKGSLERLNNARGKSDKLSMNEFLRKKIFSSKSSQGDSTLDAKTITEAVKKAFDYQRKKGEEFEGEEAGTINLLRKLNIETLEPIHDRIDAQDKNVSDLRADIQQVSEGLSELISFLKGL